MSTTTEQEQKQDAPANGEQQGAQSLAPVAPQQLPAQLPATKVPVSLGIAPKSLEEGWRLAQIMAASSLVPSGFFNKPSDVLVAIELGMEIGFAPMQALQSIAVINGRPSVWGDGFLALIMASKPYHDHDEYYEVGGERRDGLVADDWKKDDTAAVCTFWRRDKAKPVTVRFTVGQAKKGGLLAKKGPWQEYPDRMLKMRARSWAGRDCFPDVLRGLSTVEEVRDVPEFDDAPAPPPVRRISETATPAKTQAAAGDQAVRELAPATVKAVQQFMGGYAVTLGNGAEFDVIDLADATELEKFVGTDHKVRVTCDVVDQRLRLKSYGIAD